jgi:hypothetical protein
MAYAPNDERIQSVKDAEPILWPRLQVNQEEAFRLAREKAKQYGNDVFLIQMDHEDGKAFYVCNEKYLEQPEFEAFCGEVVEECEFQA